MKTMKLMAATAAVAALAVGAPAMAQTAQDQNNDVDNNDNSFVVNDLIDIYLQATDNSQDNDTLTANDINSNNNNGNSSVVAFQLLNAVNTNQYLDEVVDLDGEDGTETAVGYNSGNNVVRGSAFAAFAGILNQAWNTGINSNAQAATNIAAQGTINFGDGGAAAADAGGGGGD